MQNKPDQTSSSSSSRPTGNAGRSVLSADLKIKGDITSDGAIEILGEVEGKITTQSLLIGAEGQLKGSVSAETVEIRGIIEGQISCTSLTLRATSNVKADSNYTQLVIESGAEVEGRFTHSSAQAATKVQPSVLDVEPTPPAPSKPASPAVSVTGTDGIE